MLTETTEPEPEPEGAGIRAIAVSRHALTVGALTTVAAAVYATFALIRFWTFRTTTYDLVIFDQAVRSYSRLHLPVAIVKGVHNGFGPHFNVLGDHFSPILAVLAPLYWLHDGPATLLVAQAVLLALAIVPLWTYARGRLGVGAAYCVAGVYALAWPVATALDFDFHELAFAPLLSMLMLERHEAGRRWQCAAAAGALLLVKEDMGLLVAGFGLYLLTRTGERRLAAVFVAAGLFWTWLASRVLVPAFGGAGDYYWAYDALGRDVPHAAAYALAHPWTVAKLLVTPQVKATTMLWLVAPLLLLPFASPITLTVLPLVAERMLSSRFAHWWEPKFHYNVALTALLVAAAADGAARLAALRRNRTADGAKLRTADGAKLRTADAAAPGTADRVAPGTADRAAPRTADRAAPRTTDRTDRTGRRRRWLRVDRVWPVAALAATAAVVPHFAFKRFFEPSFYGRDAHARAAAAVLSAVPDGALVEAVNSVGPRLSGRARVLLLDDRPRWAPWVVADTEVANFPFPSVDAQRARVRLLLRDGYSVQRRLGGYVVLHRPGSVPDLRPAR